MSQLNGFTYNDNTGVATLYFSTAITAIDTTQIYALANITDTNYNYPLYGTVAGLGTSAITITLTNTAYNNIRARQLTNGPQLYNQVANTWIYMPAAAYITPNLITPVPLQIAVGNLTLNTTAPALTSFSYQQPNPTNSVDALSWNIRLTFSQPIALPTTNNNLILQSTAGGATPVTVLDGNQTIWASGLQVYIKFSSAVWNTVRTTAGLATGLATTYIRDTGIFKDRNGLTTSAAALQATNYTSNAVPSGYVFAGPTDFDIVNFQDQKYLVPTNTANLTYYIPENNQTNTWSSVSNIAVGGYVVARTDNNVQPGQTLTLNNTLGSWTVSNNIPGGYYTASAYDPSSGAICALWTDYTVTLNGVVSASFDGGNSWNLAPFGGAGLNATLGSINADQAGGFNFGSYYVNSPYNIYRYNPIAGQTSAFNIVATAVVPAITSGIMQNSGVYGAGGFRNMTVAVNPTSPSTIYYLENTYGVTTSSPLNFNNFSPIPNTAAAGYIPTNFNNANVYWSNSAIGDGILVTISNGAWGSTTTGNISAVGRNLSWENIQIATTPPAYPPGYASVATPTNNTQTIIFLPSLQNWTFLAFGNKTFVALAANTNITAAITSHAINTYGSNAVWQTGGTGLPAGSTWTNLVFGGGFFYVSAQGSLNIYQSADGLTWTVAGTAPFNPPYLQSIGWASHNGTGRLIAFGGNTNLPAVSNNANFNAVTWDGSRWIAVGSNGTIATSTDATAIFWNKSNSNVITGLRAVWQGQANINGSLANQYVVAGNGPTIMYSSDANTWTPISLTPQTNAFNGIAYSNISNISSVVGNAISTVSSNVYLKYGTNLTGLLAMNAVTYNPQANLFVAVGGLAVAGAVTIAYGGGSGNASIPVNNANLFVVGQPIIFNNIISQGGATNVLGQTIGPFYVRQVYTSNNVITVSTSLGGPLATATNILAGATVIAGPTLMTSTDGLNYTQQPLPTGVTYYGDLEDITWDNIRGQYIILPDIAGNNTLNAGYAYVGSNLNTWTQVPFPLNSSNARYPTTAVSNYANANVILATTASSPGAFPTPIIAATNNANTYTQYISATYAAQTITTGYNVVNGGLAFLSNISAQINVGTPVVVQSANYGGLSNTQVLYAASFVSNATANLLYLSSNLANLTPVGISSVGTSFRGGSNTISAANVGGGFTLGQAATLTVGEYVTFSGTFTGAGSVVGYTAPGPAVYKIGQTDGTLNFTLQYVSNGVNVSTTVGGFTGAGSTIVGSPGVSIYTQPYAVLGPGSSTNNMKITQAFTVNANLGSMVAGNNYYIFNIANSSYFQISDNYDTTTFAAVSNYSGNITMNMGWYRSGYINQASGSINTNNKNFGVELNGNIAVAVGSWSAGGLVTTPVNNTFPVAYTPNTGIWISQSGGITNRILYTVAPATLVVSSSANLYIGQKVILSGSNAIPGVNESNIYYINGISGQNVTIANTQYYGTTGNVPDSANTVTFASTNYSNGTSAMYLHDWIPVATGVTPPGTYSAINSVTYGYPTKGPYANLGLWVAVANSGEIFTSVTGGGQDFIFDAFGTGVANLRCTSNYTVVSNAMPAGTYIEFKVQANTAGGVTNSSQGVPNFVPAATGVGRYFVVKTAAGIGANSNYTWVTLANSFNNFPDTTIVSGGTAYFGPSLGNYIGITGWTPQYRLDSFSPPAGEITWTSQVINKVIWDGQRFKAAATGGRVLLSDDGVNWAVELTGVNANLSGIAYSNTVSRYAVSVDSLSGYYGNMLISPDARDWWTTVELFRYTFPYGMKSVVWGNNQFVTTGVGAVQSGAFTFTSPDGLYWTYRNLPMAFSNNFPQMNTLTYANGRYVAAGIIQLGGAANNWYSGIWSSQFAGNIGSTSNINGPTVPYVYVVQTSLGNGTTGLTSNGWAQFSSVANFYSGQELIISRYFASSVVPIGNSITNPGIVPGTTYYLNRLVPPATLDSIGGNAGNYTLATSITPLSNANLATQQIFSNTTGNWVIATDWIFQNASIIPNLIGSQPSLTGSTYGLGKYVIVGQGLTILNSNDSNTWTLVNQGLYQSSGTFAPNLNGVAFNGTTFLAVGDNSRLLMSNNASSWTTPQTQVAYANTPNTLYGFDTQSNTTPQVLTSGTFLNYASVPRVPSLDVLGVSTPLNTNESIWLRTQ